MADLGDLTPVGAGLSAIQTGIGIVSEITNKQRQKKLLGQLQPYKTPKEVYDVLNATENNASEGLDPTTLKYLTSQTDQSFSSGIDAAEKLGADPNTLSALLGQKIDSIMKIGAENHSENMTNFSQYLNALNSVAANKAAEQKSQQDIVKDKLQATGVNLQSAAGNISGGINTALATLSANKTANLYNPDGTLKTKQNPTVVFAPTGNDNGLSVDNADQSPLNNSNNTFS